MTANTNFNDDGRHSQHITDIATRLAFGAPPYSDAEQKTMCAYCHVMSDYDHTLFNATQAEVFLSNAVRGSLSLWGAVDSNATFTAGTAYTCQNVDCHNNTDTTATYNWYTGAVSACSMCHTTALNPVTDVTHTTHTGAAASYGIAITCDSCHYPTTWNVAAPTAAQGHINGSWTMDFAGPGTWTGVTYTGSWATTTNGTCGTNPCHRADLANTAPPAYTWGAPLTNDCAGCHAGTGIATRNHGAHLVSNSLPATNLTFGSTDECRACHNTTTTGAGLATAGGHLNDSLNVSFNATYDYEGTTVTASSAGTGDARTCSDIRCHNGRVTPTWAAASTVACGDCHGAGTAGNGAAHEDLLPPAPPPACTGRRRR